METREALELTKLMKSAWPSIFTTSDSDRIQMYINCLIDHQYFETKKKIDQLISSRKNFPSIAELKEYLNAGQKEDKTISYCHACDDTGWKFVNIEKNIVARCQCAS